MVPSLFSRAPGKATCSPNESLTISGSACSQTPKVNFCLFPPTLFGDLKRIVGSLFIHAIVFIHQLSVCDGRGNGAASADGVKADNYPLLALFFQPWFKSAQLMIEL